MKTLATWLAGAVIAVGLASAAWGNIYHWVGKDGQSHYSDRPPPGADAVLIQPERGEFEMPRPPENAGESGEADTAPPAGNENTGPNDPERTARIRQEQCAKARKRLEEYSGAARIQLRTNDGEIRDMTADERVQAIARAESDVSHFCADTGEE